MSDDRRVVLARMDFIRPRDLEAELPFADLSFNQLGDSLVNPLTKKHPG